MLEQSKFSAEDTKWMSRCLELAQQAADIGEVPVGAVVVQDNGILGEGFNQPISTSDPCAHAEIQALRAAAQHQNNYRLPNATMYVSVEPCTMCAGALVHSRIQRLVYGALEPRAGAVVSQAQILDAAYLNHQVKHEGGCLSRQSSALMKAFFKARR